VVEAGTAVSGDRVLDDARRPMRAPMMLVAEVEEALGPGVDFERDPGAGLIARRARRARLWLGFDRAALVESDDGLGRRIPLLVALPASTFPGARVAVELTGGFRSARGLILVGRVPGTAMPLPALARIAGNLVDPATWLDLEVAEGEARSGYRRFRERRSHARIRGGRAWHPAGSLPPELARFATPHSAAEYRLSRLPPRYLRGLEGLLDDDERVLYWIERPMLPDVSLVRRVRERVDRRAALLALTDRQLLWVVDHAQPDRYLSDWGVDVTLIPAERIIDLHRTRRDETVELAIATGAGTRAFSLPAELDDEVGVMFDLLRRFLPDGASSLPRRRYELRPIDFEPETADRFGQEREARALLAVADRRGPVLAFLFSPDRSGKRAPSALALRPTAVEQVGGTEARVDLREVRAISVTLSPLVGRLSFGPGIEISYPAPLADRGGGLVRLARRAMANLP
jgi:hypothetical protein